MGNQPKPLVSILTPCYNTGPILHRLLDSVLQQDYPTAEMYCIDDGSTDDTRSIVESYFKKFEDKGYKLYYIFQENSGQSFAINRGLKFVKGKYLLWPDSDDYYCSPSFISILVNKFEELGDEYGIIRSALQFVAEDTLEVQSTAGLDVPQYKYNELFEDCLFSRNGFYFPPVAYMCRLEYLKAVTGLNIYCAKDAGQNWQIMLPLLANYKCYTVRQILCSVLERTKSHSRGQYKGIEAIMQRYKSYDKTISHVVKSITTIDNIKKDHYITEFQRQLYSDMFNIAVSHHSAKYVRKLYLSLKEFTNVRMSFRIAYIASFIPGGLTIYSNILKLKFI